MSPAIRLPQVVIEIVFLILLDAEKLRYYLGRVDSHFLKVRLHSLNDCFFVSRGYIRCLFLNLEKVLVFAESAPGQLREVYSCGMRSVCLTGQLLFD